MPMPPVRPRNVFRNSLLRASMLLLALGLAGCLDGTQTPPATDPTSTTVSPGTPDGTRSNAPEDPFAVVTIAGDVQVTWSQEGGTRQPDHGDSLPTNAVFDLEGRRATLQGTPVDLSHVRALVYEATNVTGTCCLVHRLWLAPDESRVPVYRHLLRVPLHVGDAVTWDGQPFLENETRHYVIDEEMVTSKGTVRHQGNLTVTFHGWWPAKALAWSQAWQPHPGGRAFWDELASARGQ